MTVPLPGRLPRHSVPPSLACASVQRHCDLAHTLWSPERGTFLRINEACHLRVADIDSKQKLIYVRHPKGGQERITLLSASRKTEPVPK